MTVQPEHVPSDFDLIVSLPELQEGKGQKVKSELSEAFGLLVNIGFVAPFLLGLGAIWAIILNTPASWSAVGATVILSVWFIHSYLKNRRKERVLAPAQDRITSEIESNLGVTVTERPNINSFPTDVIIRDKEGIKHFLDIIKLDDEVNVGIRSRFRS